MNTLLGPRPGPFSGQVDSLGNILDRGIPVGRLGRFGIEDMMGRDIGQIDRFGNITDLLGRDRGRMEPLGGIRLR